MIGANDTVIVSTRVEPHLRDELKRIAREEDRTLAATIRHHLKLCAAKHGEPRDRRIIEEVLRA